VPAVLPTTSGIEPRLEPTQDVESLGEDAADTVLQRAVPNAGPARIAGVVVQLAQERRDLQEIKSPAREPGGEGAQKLVLFAGEHTDRQHPGIVLTAKAAAEVIVEGQELLLTQAHGDKRVIRETQDGEKARSTSRNRCREELQDIGIKAVVHMHTVRWGQPGAVGVQHTGVEAVRVSGSEGSNLGPRRGRCVLNGGTEEADEFDHLGVV